MNRSAAEFAITECLRQMRARPRDASATAEAALTCAEKGNIERAIEIALDLEQPHYEASRLLDAARLLKRLGLSQGSG